MVLQGGSPRELATGRHPEEATATQMKQRRDSLSCQGGPEQGRDVGKLSRRRDCVIPSDWTVFAEWARLQVGAVLCSGNESPVSGRCCVADEGLLGIAGDLT
jgi:hypothetical protein